MAAEERHPLRVLIADERDQLIEPIANAVDVLGHAVVGRETDIASIVGATHDCDPDIAIVVLHDDTDHALELISEITDASACPVMALVQDARPEFVAEAAERGIFAYLDSAEEAELRGGIDVALQRYREFKRLQEAFGRRARIERAKGVLMERHSLADQEAFERLRAEARSGRRKLMDVVDEVLAQST